MTYKDKPIFERGLSVNVIICVALMLLVLSYIKSLFDSPGVRGIRPDSSLNSVLGAGL